MPTVSFVHPKLRPMLDQYDLIRDCLAGETAVKKRRNKYLPMPDAEDTSKDNQVRYNAYLTRAVFYNVAERTQAGLVGQIFLRDPVIKIPSELQPVLDDATGEGVPMVQLANEQCAGGLAFGRGGFYTDYPSTEDDNGDTGTTRAELESGDLRPTVRRVEPWDIVNWRVIARGAKIIPSLVVFREDYTVDDDGLETRVKDQWRVLRLVDGIYQIEIYRNRIIGGKPDIGPIVPVDANGEPFDEIPFAPIGSKTNSFNVDPAPLYALCSINIAHYRNSADYEESVYVCGQPTLAVAGLTEEWVRDILGGRVGLGTRGGLPMPVGGSAQLLQADPNTLAKEAMDQKEAQMLALGAKLVEGSQVQRTATEADIDNVSEASVLTTVADNVSAAVMLSLGWAARFMGVDATGIEYWLNTEFDLVNLTPEERGQLLKEWQSGAITFEEYRDNLRRAGIATLPDAKAKADLAKEDAERLANAVKEAEAMAATQPEPATGNAA